MPSILQNFYLILFILIGLVALLTALLCPDWLLSSRGAQMWVCAFGRQGARWFYMVVGVALLVVATIGLCRL